MASKPKPAPAPDPATIASSPSETARKQQEVQFRKKNVNSMFYNVTPPTPVGGSNQQLG